MYALAADRRCLRERLKATVQQPDVREAIFVATPSLDSSLESWFQDPDSKRGQKVERALVRYFVRMAARPTPFGLLSGCAFARVGKETQLVSFLQRCRPLFW